METIYVIFVCGILLISSLVFMKHLLLKPMEYRGWYEPPHKEDYIEVTAFCVMAISFLILISLKYDGDWISLGVPFMIGFYIVGIIIMGLWNWTKPTKDSIKD